MAKFVRNKNSKGSTAVAEKPKAKKQATKEKVPPTIIESVPAKARIEARCMKHGESVVISKGELIEYVNGRLAVRGVHAKCGTNVTRFISRAQYDVATKVKGKK